MAVSKCVQYGVWANCPNKCDFACYVKRNSIQSINSFFG